MKYKSKRPTKTFVCGNYIYLIVKGREERQSEFPEPNFMNNPGWALMAVSRMKYSRTAFNKLKSK